MTLQKKVLITGADGFIGSHLTDLLLQEGLTVKAFCCYNSSGSLGWLDRLPEKALDNIEVITGDVRDTNRVREAMKDVDMVFHLAALVSIPFSYRSPENYVDTNIKGTLNVLQAAKDLQVKRVVITSTSEVYGTAQFIPITEEHPRQGQSPYSATKIGADALAESFYRSFDLPVSIARPFNTYGPRQSTRAVIPSIITQILNGRTVIQLGDLRPTRDFVYVKDTARGFLEVSRCDDLVGHDVNIATQHEISIEELARELIAQMNPAVQIVQDEQRLRPSKSEVFRLYGSNEKLKKFTGWTPEISLKEGIAETIRWFKDSENMKLYSANNHTV